jgi:hypothetical protein
MYAWDKLVRVFRDVCTTADVRVSFFRGGGSGPRCAPGTETSKHKVVHAHTHGLAAYQRPQRRPCTTREGPCRVGEAQRHFWWSVLEGAGVCMCP